MRSAPWMHGAVWLRGWSLKTFLLCISQTALWEKTAAPPCFLTSSNGRTLCTSNASSMSGRAPGMTGTIHVCFARGRVVVVRTFAEKDQWMTLLGPFALPTRGTWLCVSSICMRVWTRERESAGSVACAVGGGCVVAPLHDCVEQALLTCSLWRAASQFCRELESVSIAFCDTYDAVAIPFPGYFLQLRWVFLRLSLAGLGGDCGLFRFVQSSVVCTYKVTLARNGSFAK